MADLVEPHPDLTEPVETTFHPEDAIENTIRTAVKVGAAGLLLSAVQNTVSKENNGAWGVFSRFGRTCALFTAMGGTYAFVSTASANLRERNDMYNPVFGGAAAGALVGLRTRSFASVLGNGLALGVILGVVTYSGGSMFGPQTIHPDEGRWPTKEELRKRFRRPANETINEIGEGRGIYGPGYAERRVQRLKDAYGIDTPAPHWESKAEPLPMQRR